MDTVYLSTAYLAPVQYYCKMIQYRRTCMEAHEHFLKQTYRNRCYIAAANGSLPLTIPVEKGEADKVHIRDVRISGHGNWRHLHWNALVSAYNMSPFFEYYEDDFAPFYQKKYTFLWDFNEELRRLICSLVDIHPTVVTTSSYGKELPADYREVIRPKHPVADPAFRPLPYYQVFQGKHGFLPNLSIVDLLFNMGPESLLILHKSIIPNENC